MEHIYQHNPILKYTQGPLYAPLLPFPYGSLEHTCKCLRFLHCHIYMYVKVPVKNNSMISIFFSTVWVSVNWPNLPWSSYERDNQCTWPLGVCAKLAAVFYNCSVAKWKETVLKTVIALQFDLFSGRIKLNATQIAFHFAYVCFLACTLLLWPWNRSFFHPNGQSSNHLNALGGIYRGSLVWKYMPAALSLSFSLTHILSESSGNTLCFIKLKNHDTMIKLMRC